MEAFLAELAAQLVKMVGPYLSKKLQDWLSGLFGKVSADVADKFRHIAAMKTDGHDEMITPADKAAVAEELIEQALAAVKGPRPMKRALLHVLARVVPPVLEAGGTKLKKGDGGSEVEAVAAKVGRDE